MTKDFFDTLAEEANPVKYPRTPDPEDDVEYALDLIERLGPAKSDVIAASELESAGRLHEHSLAAQKSTIKACMKTVSDVYYSLRSGGPRAGGYQKDLAKAFSDLAYNMEAFYRQSERVPMSTFDIAAFLDTLA